MGGNSGGGGSGGRSNGGGSGGNALQVAKDNLQKVETQIKTLSDEIAKTDRAYDAATQAGDMSQRKMLRDLRTTLIEKRSDIAHEADNAMAKAKYDNWIAGGKKGLEPRKSASVRRYPRY